MKNKATQHSWNISMIFLYRIVKRISSYFFVKPFGIKRLNWLRLRDSDIMLTCKELTYAKCFLKITVMLRQLINFQEVKSPKSRLVKNVNQSLLIILWLGWLFANWLFRGWPFLLYQSVHSLPALVKFSFPLFESNKRIVMRWTL